MIGVILILSSPFLGAAIIQAAKEDPDVTIIWPFWVLAAFTVVAATMIALALPTPPITG